MDNYPVLGSLCEEAVCLDRMTRGQPMCSAGGLSISSYAHMTREPLELLTASKLQSDVWVPWNGGCKDTQTQT